MLNAVPRGINEAGRRVVLNHPNSIPAVIMRKRVLGANGPLATPDPDEAGILSTEDEADYEWDSVGEARVLFTGGFPGASVVDRNDSLVPVVSSTALIEFVVQPQSPPGEPDPPRLVAEKYDVAFLLIGQGVNMPFEVVDVSGSVMIPPYTRTYGLNPRDDLDYLEDEIQVSAG